MPLPKRAKSGRCYGPRRSVIRSLPHPPLRTRGASDETAPQSSLALLTYDATLAGKESRIRLPLSYAPQIASILASVRLADREGKALPFSAQALIESQDLAQLITPDASLLGRPVVGKIEGVVVKGTLIARRGPWHLIVADGRVIAGESNDIALADGQPAVDLDACAGETLPPWARWSFSSPLVQKMHPLKLRISLELPAVRPWTRQYEPRLADGEAARLTPRRYRFAIRRWIAGRTWSCCSARGRTRCACRRPVCRQVRWGRSQPARTPSVPRLMLQLDDRLSSGGIELAIANDLEDGQPLTAGPLAVWSGGGFVGKADLPDVQSRSRGAAASVSRRYSRYHRQASGFDQPRCRGLHSGRPDRSGGQFPGAPPG